MPFAKKYKEVYDEVYKPVCNANGIDCLRVDEISRPGSITRDIIENILDADIIIADLTSRNPNVFYELGIAHVVGNKTIMTTQDIKDVPFDIANYRVIEYDQSISGSKALYLSLEKSIRQLLDALDRTNNPFQEVASSRISFGKKSKTPLIKYINVAQLPGPMRDYIREKKIIYAEEINDLDLQEMKNRNGLGRISLGDFFSQVLEHDLYQDVEKLQEFIIENGISIKSVRRRYY